MKNCLMSCQHYNEFSNTCTAPRADDIMTFNRNKMDDCPLYKFKLIESPQVNNENFVQSFCIGFQCPIYNAKSNVCTRPSKCPYKEFRPEKIVSLDI